MSATVSKRSSVIKAGSRNPGECSPHPFYLTDLFDEAKQLVADRQAKAEALVAAAERESASIREKAREAGRLEGLEAGQQEGREIGRTEALEQAKQEFAAQHANLAHACRELMNEIEASRSGWEAAARRDLTDLAMAIAGRVVKCVGQREREAVLANLDEAVKLVGARSDVTILVSPADADAAERFAKELTNTGERWKHVRLITEESISPGGCRIRWDSGAVDATLQTQLERIATALSNDVAGDGIAE
jgi:flagellar assembly protein FliH